MGIALLTLALGFGAGLAALLTAFPLPVLAGLLATAGLLHIGLLRDLSGLPAWALALAVGVVGYEVHLAVALAGGLAVYWGVRAGGALGALRPRPA
jgi:sulfate permease, SulP family